MSVGRVLSILAACLSCIVAHAPVAGQEASRTSAVAGGIIGAGIGVGAGLLFAHDSCDMDPCGTGAYVTASALGAALLGASGALIGSEVRIGGARARNGALLGVVVGAAAGIALVSATCETDECGAAGYTSVALVGAGVVGALGAMIGGRDARPSSARLEVGPTLLEAILAPAPGRVMIGARLRT